MGKTLDDVVSDSDEKNQERSWLEQEGEETLAQAKNAGQSRVSQAWDAFKEDLFNEEEEESPGTAVGTFFNVLIKGDEGKNTDSATAKNAAASNTTAAVAGGLARTLSVRGGKSRVASMLAQTSMTQRRFNAAYAAAATSKGAAGSTTVARRAASGAKGGGLFGILAVLALAGGK